ncbi:MAG: cobalamin-dependent protein [Candidatus Lokiarchaeota archaeon]|nr:cobalamin-dependent protein [Candidatus Lokiarchaeota archaeon]
MKSYDAIFIHPPKNTLVPKSMNSHFARGTYIFVPMGTFAIADLLEKEGFSVKIINYPLEKILNPHWDLQKHLKEFEFELCGIDLHWLHNSYGAIEVAKSVKHVNPNAKVLFGGFSASYYHDEILNHFKVVDGIVRGEGEIPFLQYLREYKKGSDLSNVSNLTYRNTCGSIKVNPLSYCAKTLENLNFTNLSLMDHAKEYIESCKKIMGIPFNLSIGRGCPFNCPFCSGGQQSQQKLTGRIKVLLRDPKKILDDISTLYDDYKIESVFFGHGTYPATFKYWKELFGLIRNEKFDIGGDIEIWRLPFPKDMWKLYYKTFTQQNTSISISPRTLSQKVQNMIAKICDPTFKFPENQIESLIKNANLYGLTLRIWLTIGYPFQTLKDIIKDFYFTYKCFWKYGLSKSNSITFMNEPYYIFPSSPVHEQPEKFGLKLKYKSFLEVMNAFKRSKISFFYNIINYDKKHMSGVSIQNLNKLLLVSSIPMFLTASKKKKDKKKLKTNPPEL